MADTTSCSLVVSSLVDNDSQHWDSFVQKWFRPVSCYKHNVIHTTELICVRVTMLTYMDLFS